MPTTVTVVAEDKIILVDGVALHFDFQIPDNVRAIQWRDDAGHAEYADGSPNRPLSAADYETEVAPYVALWEAEKARLEAEAAKAEEERQAEENKPENVRARKLAEINAKCEAALAALTLTYPERELLTFDKQEAEARAYQADSGASVPLLTSLAAGRGISVADLAGRVIAKADAFTTASGWLIGQRQRLEDTLDACETVEAVRAIEVNYSLPGAGGAAV